MNGLTEVARWTGMFLVLLVVATACTTDNQAVPNRAAAPLAVTPLPMVESEAEPLHESSDRPSVVSTTAVDNVRDVDFLNGFDHSMMFEEDLVVTVVDGVYGPDDSMLSLHVVDVAYGNLDDDDADEAVVWTGFNTGGSGQFGRLTVWDLVDGALVDRGWTGTGDRADGGLNRFEIRDQAIVAETFLSDQGACCPNMLIERRLLLGAEGLVEAETSSIRRWMPVGNSRPGSELEFIPGTSSAVLAVEAAASDGPFAFEAAADQWVTLTRRHGPARDIALRDEAGEMLWESAAPAAVQLPMTGRYTIAFSDLGPGEVQQSDYDIAITQRPVPTGPTWSTELRQLVVGTDPNIVLTAAVPHFDVEDYGSLNFAIDRWMDEQTDWWVADAIEFPPLVREGDEDSESSGGTYELTYEVTLITDTVASIRWHWYEYVCCRPYPNYGNKALVVDLASGRIIDHAEILDMNRLDEIHEIWLAEAAAQEVLPAEAAFQLRTEDGPAFSSLAIVPGGIEFGTDRSGPLPGTTTVVRLAALDDLVRAEFAAHARNGVAPTRIAASEAESG